MEQEFTKYETARILGARALQIAMDAPLLIDITKEKLEEVNYDPIKLANLELTSGVLPITVKRPMPKRSHDKIKKRDEEKKEEPAEGEKKEEKKEEQPHEEVGEHAEEEVAKEGHEIMEMASPEDESDSETSSDSSYEGE